MDDTTETVEEIQANENLLSYPSTQMQWQSFKIVSLNDFIQIDTKDLENEAKVISIWSFMNEAVQETDDVCVILVEWSIRIMFLEGRLPLRRPHLLLDNLQNLHLIV